MGMTGWGGGRVAGVKIFVDVWPNYRDTFACFEKFNIEVLRYAEEVN